MMNLYLLRHGIAVEPFSPRYPRDFDRVLTPKGKRKMRVIAKAMKKMELSFDLVLSSPSLRARETAEIVAAALKHKVELLDALAPDGSSKKLLSFLERVKPAPENVLLVGHEPSMSQLISLLVSGDAGIAVVMKKGGLCRLSVGSLRHGRCAALEWLLTPAQLCLMA
jgi:phosphohistidine phosphatase